MTELASPDAAPSAVLVEAVCARTGATCEFVTMQQEGLVPTRAYSKCAGVVGEVLKHYHPHGDSAVYDALVRLAQDWNLRYPLIDGQGNFGSIDGDPPAAMRYTESRMAKVAHALLEDIDKDTVDFQPNYDGNENEPVVLPARFPNLLVNGGGGIDQELLQILAGREYQYTVGRDAGVKQVEQLTTQIDACVLGGGMYPLYEQFWTQVATAPDEVHPLMGHVPTAAAFASTVTNILARR